MSDPTPPPLPPLPTTSAAQVAGVTANGPARGTTATDPADIDDTGVPAPIADLSDAGRGFLSALFDISFRTFITRRLASAFYVVGLVAIAIGFIYYFVSGLITAISFFVPPYVNIGAGVTLLISTLIIVPIIAFLAIVILRFLIEAVVALIAIAENTQRTAENSRYDAKS